MVKVERERKECLPCGAGTPAPSPCWQHPLTAQPHGTTAPHIPTTQIFREAEVYLNGNKVAHHRSGYTGFEVQLGTGAESPAARALPFC